MPKPRTYYTLAIRSNGVWSPQFGDYDREVVEQEGRDMRESGDWEGLKAKDCKVISTNHTQADIHAAIIALNAKAAT